MRLDGGFIATTYFKGAQVVDFRCVFLYFEVEADRLQLLIFGVCVVFVDHAVETSGQILYFLLSSVELRFSFG